MIARLLPLEALRGERYFRWRGDEVSRLEGLSDGVFALAITLLVLSTEVPQSYDELLETLRGIPAFAACFALFVLLWYYHFQFHRRFGLESLYTVVLNLCLLFLILVYVYPAKFLFNALATGGPPDAHDHPRAPDPPGRGRRLHPARPLGPDRLVRARLHGPRPAPGPQRLALGSRGPGRPGITMIPTTSPGHGRGRNS